MKIESANARPVRLRFDRPMRTALGEFFEREIVLLELRDPDGHCGWGEAAPWPGYGMEAPAESLAALQELVRIIVGADIEDGDVGRAWTSLSGRPAARAAAAGAFTDLAARRAGRPLRDELAATIGDLAAGAPLARVPVSTLLAGESPEDVAADAARARDAGFRAAKLKLGGRPLAVDQARLRAARDVLGREYRLRGDANGAWSADEALAAFTAFAGFDLEYVEQPVGVDDVEGFVRLKGRTPVRIAADESVATEALARQLIERAAVDVVVLKPAMLGGCSRALDIAARARRSGIGVVFTHAFESAVGARHALHCAAAWGDGESAHGLVTEGLFEHDVAEPVTADAGQVAIADQAGLGITP
jgi:o-succinylbenzoate synthase